MGSAYVNDFDFNNRSYRVYVQADKQFRSHPQDIGQYYVRSDSGAMIPLQNLVTIDQSSAPQVISHYNLFRSTEIDGSAAPGYSSGQAIDAMQQMSAKMLPQGYVYQWTGISLEELASGSTTLLLFGLGTLVVYLTLSAQYESFVLPFIILLAVPMALLGALPRNGFAASRTTSTARWDWSCWSASPRRMPSSSWNLRSNCGNAA